MNLFSFKYSGNYLHALASLSAMMIMLAGLNACGFQLRGSIALSADISPIYIEQNSAFDLAREIKTLLATNNIRMVDTASQSRSQLILLNDEKSRRVLSVDSSGRVREYLLTYKAGFVVQTNAPETAAIVQAGAVDDKTAAEQESVLVTRTLVFDPDAVLAVTNEAEIIYKDMQREAARLILLKLQARSNNRARSSGVSDTSVDTGAGSEGENSK